MCSDLLKNKPRRCCMSKFSICIFVCKVIFELSYLLCMHFAAQMAMENGQKFIMSSSAAWV